MVSNYIIEENIKRIANGFWILGIILLFLVPLAQAEPSVTSYWGYITIDGTPASNAQVTVLNSACGGAAGATSTDGGLYQIIVPWENSSFNQAGVKAGEAISLLVNGKFATLRVIDPKGSNNKLDLAILSSAGTYVCKTVEIRGEVAEGPFLWDANNFPAFFYDFQSNIKTETLNISSIDGRIIPQGQIIYSTSPEEVSFNYSNFGKYQAIGFMAEKYFAGYTENTTPRITRPPNDFRNLSTLSHGQLHKVLINDDTKRTISVGGTIALKEDYVLKATDIDPNSRTMLLSLLKNGTEVDLSPISTGETYVYSKNISYVENLPLILVRIDNIFSGQELEVAFIKGVFQLSENPTMVIVGNQFGNMNVTSVTQDAITMNNSMDINLDKNTNTLLMGDIKLKIADNDALRYYPFIEYTRPGVYEVRGMVFDEPMQRSIFPSWNAKTFAGLYYDLNYDRSTENLGITSTMEEIAAPRMIEKERLWYNTTAEHVDFKAYEKEGVQVDWMDFYYVVGWQGEKYAAIKGVTKKLAKLVLEMGKEDKKTLMTGETWSLGAGYELTVNDISARTSPRKVWFTLKKDGVVIDEGIGQAPTSGSISDKQKAVYYKTKTILDESDALLFTVYVDTIFSGATSDMVQFKYAWLVDESSAKEIKVADKFGVFEVRTSNWASINLSNENAINLSKNTELPLLGDLNFKVADSDQLRFYPKKDFMIPDQSMPPTDPSVLINNGDANTSSNSVTLGICAGNATEMSFSNNNINWSSWEPFSGTKSWKLSNNNGLKTVYFRARNAAGESSIASDTIILATPVRPKVNAVEIRGTVVTGTLAQSWNAQSFAGFYYDLKYDGSTENLAVLSIDGTTIQKDNLWYNTTIIPSDFKAYEMEGIRVYGKSSYDVVGWSGEKFIGINGMSNKLARLVLEMGREDKKTMAVNETWQLGSGYELKVNAIDGFTYPQQVLFTLSKNGDIIDEGIGQAPTGDTISEKEKAVYYKTMTIQGESDALLFTVYVDNIFSGKSSEIVQFKYGWLIDKDSAVEIKIGERYGVFEVQTANLRSINLSNEEIVSLSRNSETALMGNIKFRTVDNNTLRYYPYVEYTAPGIYEVRGAVVSGRGPQSWNARSFAGFYYDLQYDRSTETLNLIGLDGITVEKEQLWYNTTIARVDFKVFEKENVIVNSKSNYSLVGWQGEKWIAVNNKARKIAKLAFEMGKEDKETFANGSNWSLGSGYEMTIDKIDARSTPRQVWFTIRKDGIIIDEGIGQARQGSTVEDKQKAVYFKTKTILGESDSLLFTVYIDAIFSGATSEYVQFKYAWLIDESSAWEIKPADKFGVFEVRTANDIFISLSNEYPVSLSKNTEIPLIGDIKFKVADNNTLRFYPKIDREIGGAKLLPHSLSILINQGDAYARSRNVTLSISAINATEMSFSSDGSSWSPWESYATSKSWALEEGEGLKTIYFKARNSAGEAAPVNDSIILDTIPPSVNIVSPANDTIVNTPNITIIGSAYDISGITAGSITHIFENGGGGGGWPENNLALINFSHNITLHEGNNQIIINYFDAANNSGSASVHLKLSTSSSTVSFEIPGVNMSVNSSRRLNLTLGNAPNGLSGYNITISSSNGSVAQISDVRFPEWASLHSNSSLPSGTVWIKAADINKNIEAGASNIILARLEISGEAVGTADVVINVQSMDDENGTTIDPGTLLTRINVISIPALPGLSKPPTDPDNDELYEDINGNGKKDFNDVVLFFDYIDWIAENEPLHNFDFNGNGRIDFNDIIRLFEEL